MLYTFENHTEIPEILKICSELSSLKKRIISLDFENPFSEFDICKKLFGIVKDIAISNKNEQLANAQKVYACYFKFFSLFANYQKSLSDGQYKSSWNYLQDCLDEAKVVGRFVELDGRKEIPRIVDILLQYEKLYPYKVFVSSEYVISKSHCSICGKSMQSLECRHRKGELYWGDFAVEVIDDIKEVQAVCLVSHPEDKRCIIEASDDKNISEKEKFKKLDEFLNLRVYPLQYFEINSKIEHRRDLQIQKVNRNDRCPCGSGKKFKRCCINGLYYKHERIVISPSWKVQLLI